MEEWNYQNFAEEFSVAVDGPDRGEFSGQFEAYWSSSQIRYRGVYEREFRRTGVHQSFWESGTLREHARWKNGFVVGTLQRFRPNGTLEEEYFFGSSVNGPWHYLLRVYDDSESLIYVYEMQGYEELNRWTSLELLKHDGEDAPFPDTSGLIDNGGVDFAAELDAHKQKRQDDSVE